MDERRALRRGRLAMTSLTGVALCAALLMAATTRSGAGDPIEVVRGTEKQEARPGQSAPSSDASDEQAQTRVEVFLTDWCPYCQRLEAFLRENGVPYVRKNIEADPVFRQEHAELGGGGIPVTRIDGTEVVRGFRPDVIARALGLEIDG